MPTPQSPAPNAEKSSNAHHKFGVVIAGLDRPEMINDVLKEHPPTANGFSVPIYVLEPDESIAKSDSAISVLDQISPQSRIRVFTGARCVEDFHAYCRDRLECALPRHIVATGQRSVPVAQSAAAGLDRLMREQTQRTQTVRSSIDKRWAERGLEYWNERFSQINAGQPARVLIVTSRFSTFLRHSAQDLVDSLRTLGHDAKLLMEPNEHTSMKPLLCVQEISSFDPDMTLAINYPRAMHPEMFPDGCPHVCWIQDAMTHLFQANESPTILDFVVGHIFSDADSFAHYHSKSALEFPVPASECKFHNKPVSTEASNKFACDIAYVSHQSQTPQEFHAQFVESFPDNLKPMINKCRDAIHESMDNWCEEPQYFPLIDIRNTLTTQIGRGDNPVVRDMLWFQYINPLAERIIRHETLQWAAQIAKTHNLSFKLFGRGWENHPTLAQFAHGEIAHDDDLRASYQTAKVHLHASINGCGHQRIFECALSAGLPLCRRSWDELQTQYRTLINGFLNKQLPPDATLVAGKLPAHVIANHPDLQRAIEFRARLKPIGWDYEHTQELYARQITATSILHNSIAVPPIQMRPIETLGDPSELTFSTYEDLEEQVLRAVNNPSWRTHASQGMADRVQEHVTMTAFTQQLVGMVSDRLATLQDTTNQSTLTETVGQA